ncbi:MAG: hypothetical protein ACO307_19305, partial [Ilumatobacteraceae bacterium]
MNHLEATKSVVGHTENLTAAQTHTLVIDRLGYEYVSLDVAQEPWTNAGFTSQASFTVLKLSESDDNSSYSDVTAFVGGGTGGFTLPTPTATAGDVVVRMDVDCRGRKRYLRVTATPYTTGT